jgi:Co/Zn/Cd efflux system component
MRTRFWLESALAGLTAALFVLTLVWRDWIEAIFKVDPDQYSGSFEWMIVAVCGLLTVGFGFLARYEWRRSRLLTNA